jgi:hypothetical protein
MKKSFRLLTMVAMTLVLALSSCGTHKKATSGNQIGEVTDSLTKEVFLNRVQVASDLNTQFVASKVKFTIEMGAQKLNLTGNLRIKRDDVIRLQLMAFGFVEAGRMEFTKDYVLILDRINKQYIKCPYDYIPFLRNSGINYFTLQALFWNELFIPGKQTIKEKEYDKFTTDLGGDEAVIYLDRGKISYSWLVNQETNRIKMTNIMYRDPYNGNSHMNWNYLGYGVLNGKLFPDNVEVTLGTPKKEVKLTLKLNYLKSDDQWELRTPISEKYRQVQIEDLMGRIMSSF